MINDQFLVEGNLQKNWYKVFIFHLISLISRQSSISCIKKKKHNQMPSIMANCNRSFMSVLFLIVIESIIVPNNNKYNIAFYKQFNGSMPFQFAL